MRTAHPVDRVARARRSTPAGTARPRWRRRGIALAVATAIAASLLAPSAAFAGFEESHTLASWSQFATGGTDVTVTSDAVAPHGGAAAAKITSTTPRATNAYGGVVQSIAVQPSTQYEFSAWVKADALASAAAAQIVLSADWATRKTLPSGTYDWQKITWTYTTSSSQSALDYRFLLQDTGTIWLDDLTLNRVGSTQNLIVNGGFETFATTPPATAAQLGITTPSLIFTSAAPSIALTSNRASIQWIVTDHAGAVVTSGTLAVSGGKAQLDLNSLDHGYYALELTTSGASPKSHKTSFAYLPPQVDDAQGSDSRFGISYSAAFLEMNQMKTIDQVGATYVRFDVSWARIEPTKGQYTMPQFFRDKFDAIVDAGMRPLVILNYRNKFYDQNRTPSSPEAIAGFAAYAGYVASQFGDDADYEVYNEFNSTGFNDGTCGLTADCYLDILRATTPAIHAAAPDAQVSGPALAGIDMDWMTRFFELGGLDHLDAVSIHKYAQNSAPEGVTAPLIVQLQELIRRYNDGEDVPLWLTETGYNTGTTGVTESQQADFVARDMVLNLHTGLDREYWYGFVDACLSADNKECRYGILRNMNEGLTVAAPKPAYVAYATLTRQLAHHEPAGMENLAAGAYSGTFRDGSGHVTRVMWATTPQSVTIQATGPVEITDQWGHAETRVPEGGSFTLALGGQAVYVSGPVVSVSSQGVPPGVVEPETPTYSPCVTGASVLDAGFPAAAGAGEMIDVAVSVDCTGTAQAAPATVSFETAGGDRRILVPARSGTTSNAVLRVPADAVPGAQQVDIVARLAGTTIAEFSSEVSVVDNQVELQIIPRLTEGVLDADLTIANRSRTTALTTASIAAEIGDGRFSSSAPIAVDADDSAVVSLGLSGLPLWAGLAQSVSVEFTDGITRKITGTTALAPAYPRAVEDAPRADLREVGRVVSLTGDGNTEASDLGGTMWVSNDGDSLVVRAEITDDVHVPSPDAPNIWTKDSIQFAFAAPGATAAERFEIGAGALADGRGVVYGFAGVTGVLPSAKAEVDRDEESKVTSYTVTIPKNIIGLSQTASVIDYSFLVNDSDGTGRTGYIEWGSGIGETKNPAQYLPLVLTDEVPVPDTTPPLVAGLPEGPVPADQPLRLAVTAEDRESGVSSLTVTVGERDVEPDALIDLAGLAGDVVVVVRATNGAGLVTEMSSSVLVVPANGADTAPGEGVLSHTSGWRNGLHDGYYDVVMDVWWGQPGTVLRLFENDVLVATHVLPGTGRSQSDTFAFSEKANGTYVYTAELINTEGVTRTTTTTVEVVDAAPGAPVVSATGGARAIDVVVDMWWGTNASSYRILLDGEVVDEGTLEARSPGAQRASARLEGVAPGEHTVTAVFVNARGESTSAPVRVSAGA